MTRSARVSLICALSALVFVGCYEDNEIEPVIDATVPECEGAETAECVVEGGCIGTQTCSDGAFGPCMAPAEVCDGIDNNCDGTIDEGYAGLGDPCTAGEGVCTDKGVLACNAAGDGVECNAAPGDGTNEVCDGVDNDCDGEIDNDVPAGMECDTGRAGACGVGATACVNGDTICEATVEPSDEVCDGIDNDCDGRTDEGENGGALAQECYDGPEGTAGTGACVAGVQVCTDGAFGACAEQVVPGDEICDGIDNDCNGEVDDAEGVECVCVPGTMQPCYGGDDGTEGVGACRGGMQTCNEDGTGYGECEGQVVPGVELCDGIDNDCDGEVDDAAGVGDACTVGQGACAGEGTRVCDLDIGQVVCDAEEGLPGDEICDGIDNDCDGMVDDVDGVGEPCAIGEGACLSRGVQACGDGELACNAEVIEPSDEICDGIDNDCNGVVDDAPGVGEDCSVGVGVCRSTAVTVCDPAAGEVTCPATAQDAGIELCGNRLDDDCDGETDEEECVVPCLEDGECGPGAICENNGCVPGCRDDDGCGFREICEEGQCVPGDCRDDVDCGDGELCLDGFCTAGDCRDDTECADGEVCSANNCIPFPEECVDAPVIGFGVTVGSNVDAGDDFQGSCNPSSQDVVFQLDAGGYVGPVCATTDGSDYDTKLFARADCARQDTELGCDDDGGIGVDSEIEFDIDGEAFIFVDGFSASTGNFVLTVTEGPCACRGDGDCAEGEACRIGACTPVTCGDGVVEGPEQCDDGDLEAGDGCSDTCEVEAGWLCDEATGRCAEVEGLFDGVERTPGELLPENGIAPGGEAFVNECAGDQVIIGAEAAIGGGIDRMRALCADMELGGDRLILDPAGTTASVGNGEAEFGNRIVCPPNHAVSGYVALAPAGIALLCTPITLEGGRLTFGEPVQSAVLGAGALEIARETCPEGTAAGAHAGRADDVAVYAFSLRCDGYDDLCRGASGCEPIGDCFDDAACGEGETCVDFNCTAGEICDDGVGNNGNDLTDCNDDAFCADHPACTAGACEIDDDCGGNPCVDGVCGLNLPGIPLAIAVPGHHTATFGELDEMDPTWERPNAGCQGGGPDGAKFYEMRTIVNATGAQQQLTIQTTDPDFDGYLHVFADPFDPALVPEGCITGNDDAFPGSRVTDVEIAPGERLVLVVSTFGDGATGAYTIDIRTQQPREECSDGFDNDDDGLVDCDDPDCGQDLACAEPEVCDDGIDNDLDGDVDCDDGDCFGDGACVFVCAPDEFEGGDAEPEAFLEAGVYEGLTICGGDADGDDLYFVSVCPGGTLRATVTHPEAIGPANLLMGYFEEPGPQVDGTSEAGVVSGEATNEGGFENTVVIVGADPDFVYDLELEIIGCEPQPEVCDDGVDNDFDGATDCDDLEDCALDPACLAEEICDDSFGNNGNSATDCLDAACVDHPSCQYEPVPEGVEPASIAAPGHFIGFVGALEDGGEQWARPNANCTPADPADHYFQPFPVLNDTGAPQQLRITGSWPADGYVHVFADPFDPAVLDNCIAGDDDFNGIGQSRLENIDIADGEVLWIVASTFGGNVTLDAFDIEVLTEPDEVCDDGLDNDDDTLIDCLDLDCVDDEACLEPQVEICDDGIDNDGDGAIDCEDEDCALDPACIVAAEVCDDFFGNDGNNATDCLDEACVDHPSCQYEPVPEGVEPASIAQPGHFIGFVGALEDGGEQWGRPSPGCAPTDPADHYFQPFPVLNDTGAPQQLRITGSWPADGYLHVYADPFDPAVFDNCVVGNDDFGGLGGSRVENVAIADGEVLWIVASTFGGNVTMDAFSIEVLTEPDEVCDDGLDNDDDTLTDCLDPDCAGEEVCLEPQVEICDDGIDNDLDLDVDCADVDCADDPACVFVCAPDEFEGTPDPNVPEGELQPGLYEGLTICGADAPHPAFGPSDTFAVPVCPGGIVQATVTHAEAAGPATLVMGYIEEDAPQFQGQAEGGTVQGGAINEGGFESAVVIVGAEPDLVYDLEIEVIGCDAVIAACEAPTLIEDYGTYEGSTAEGSNDVPSASCQNNANGNEAVFAFNIPEVPTTVCFQASGFDTVLYARGGDCAAGEDVGCNDDGGGIPGFGSQLELTTMPGVDYFLFVDGFNNNSGDFTLEAIAGTCAAPGVELCENGADDDGDGAADCDDADCAADPACQVVGCATDVEPNNDIATATPIMPGVSDCGVIADGGDEDYSAVDVCAGGTITATLDGFVGDFDIFLYDADGNELDRGFTLNPVETAEFTTDAGQPVFVRVDGSGAAAGGYTLDVQVACPPEGEICDNMADDDGDGAVDCEDADCADDVACVALQTEVPLDGVEVNLRSMETNLGDLIADSLVWQGQQTAMANGTPMPTVAITNAGGIRGDAVTPAGELVDPDFFDSVLPFGNTVVNVDGVSRADFVALIENGVSLAEQGPQGRFPQVAGFSFVYDAGNPVGSRVIEATLADGTPIVANGILIDGAPLVVATNNFIAGDRDGYVFPDAQEDTGVDMRDALRGYIRMMLGAVVTAEAYPEGGAGRIGQRDPEVCDDLIDNDLNGDIDCADADCADDPACIPALVACDEPALGAIDGPGQYPGSTADSGNEQAGSCGGAGSNDEYFTFEVGEVGSWCLNTAGSGYDTVLYVRENNCPDPTSEVACNDDGGGLPGFASQLELELRPGRTYSVFIEGFNNNSGDFVLNVDRGLCVAEICDDGIDNDEDGDTDCGDSECADDAACQALTGLVITEVMQNPSAVADGNGEWFEVYNGTGADVDLEGWTFAEEDRGNAFTVVGSLVIPADGYLVFGKNADLATNGGLPVDYEFGGDMALGNGSDDIQIVDPQGNTVSGVNWDNGATFPDPNGASMQFDANTEPTAENVADGSNWCEAVSAYGDGDLGTPGAPNEPCAPAAVAVQFCRLQFPETIEGFEGETVTVYGRLFQAGITDRSTGTDIDESVAGELGYIADGDDPADPASWTWIDAVPNPDWDAAAVGAGDEDEYQADLVLPAEGLYSYAYRFTVDGGVSTQLCDLDPGAGANINAADPASTFDLAEAGAMLTEVDPCIAGCADAAACNFLVLVGVPDEATCVQQCQAGAISRDQAQCVADANDPPACDPIATINCQ